MSDSISDKTPSSSSSYSSTPAMIITWIGLALAAVFVIMATQKFRRTKGKILKYHGIFALVVVLMVLLCPRDVKVVVFSPLGVVIAGSVFPIYESLRAICSPSTADDMEWLQYWTASGAVYFITAFLKDYELASENVQLGWYQFEFFFFIWLYLPFTDGSTLVFDYITRPLLSPIVDPISKKLNTAVSGLIMTIVNASHLWFLWAFFVILPKDLKRFVTVAVGTVYPILASITAVSTPDKADDTFWLTYWACYGILFLIMDWTETWVGRIWGFYTVVLFSTVYLMLPMFNGADKVFRNVLVPLAGLKESLLMRDAVLLKKDLMASLPPERQRELRKFITDSFNTETPDIEDDDDDEAMDTRISISAENAKSLLVWGGNPWKRRSNAAAAATTTSRKNNDTTASGDQQEPPNESTSLV